MGRIRLKIQQLDLANTYWLTRDPNGSILLSCNAVPQSLMNVFGQRHAEARFAMEDAQTPPQACQLIKFLLNPERYEVSVYETPVKVD